jgi:hypothetical protein
MNILDNFGLGRGLTNGTKLTPTNQTRDLQVSQTAAPNPEADLKEA